jgi:nickel-type superoxide dismutase maturation protease
MAPKNISGKKRGLGTVAVDGQSMAPTYSPGDWLLVLWGGVYRKGQVVIIERENQPGVFLIKRVLREVEGRFWVEGDNVDASTDSRQWGPISRSEIVASVLFRIRKVGSRRPRFRDN